MIAGACHVLHFFAEQFGDEVVPWLHLSIEESCRILIGSSRQETLYRRATVLVFKRKAECEASKKSVRAPVSLLLSQKSSINSSSSRNVNRIRSRLFSCALSHGAQAHLSSRRRNLVFSFCFLRSSSFPFASAILLLRPLTPASCC